ncbi:hypothetical protein JQN58_01850 [Aneurinibacillus sp. BA2021]|nr:hypothetical protein [Aneurinibacillus sp. BA2021]
MSHPLTLEAGAKQQVLCTAAALSDVREIQVSFVDHTGTTIQKEMVKLRLLPAETMMIGIISEAPEQLAYVSKLKLPLPEGYNIAPVRVVPGSEQEGLALDSLPFLLVDRVPGTMMTPEQEKTVRAWIERGGVLLNGKNSPLFSSHTDVQKLGRGFIIPVQQELLSQPAMAELEQGMRAHLTAEVLSRVLHGQRLTDGMQTFGETQAVADRLLQPPYERGIAVISVLALYAVCMWGIAYVRPRNRLYMSGVILGCSLLFVGFGMVEGVTQSRQVAARIVVHGVGGSERALTKVYPLQAQPLQVRFSDADRIADWGGTAVRIDGVAQTLSYASSGPHAMYSEGHHRRDKQENDELSLSVSPDQVTGTMQNPLSETMYHSFLLIGDAVIPTGDVEGKEKVRIAYKPAYTLRNTGDYERMERIVRAAELTDGERALYTAYVNAVRKPGWDAMWFGFVQEEREVEINGKQRHVSTHTLHAYPLTLPNSSYLEGVISPVVYESDSTSFLYEQQVTKEKPLLLYYSVAPERATNARFILRTKEEAEGVHYEVYDAQAAMWKPLPQDWSQLASYTQQGTLMIKVSGEGRIFTPSLTIEEGGK